MFRLALSTLSYLSAGTAARRAPRACQWPGDRVRGFRSGPPNQQHLRAEGDRL